MQWLVSIGNPSCHADVKYGWVTVGRQTVKQMWHGCIWMGHQVKILSVAKDGMQMTHPWSWPFSLDSIGNKTCHASLSSLLGSLTFKLEMLVELAPSLQYYSSYILQVCIVVTYIG